MRFNLWNVLQTWWFHRRESWDWMFNNKGGNQERIIKEKNQLTCLKEKAIATAAVKGKLWTSLGSKQSIQHKLKVNKIYTPPINLILNLKKIK